MSSAGKFWGLVGNIDEVNGFLLATNDEAHRMATSTHSSTLRGCESNRLFSQMKNIVLHEGREA